MGTKLLSYIHIKNQRAFLNGQAFDLNTAEHPFLKALYKYLNLKYPKFYKMDELSKLGFIASELLLQNTTSKSAIESLNLDKVGIVLQNSDSTIDVDSRFYDSIIDEEKYFPSPALFVYTLPNIVLGEISIRNKFKGENALFIFEKYNADFGVNYINGLFEKNKIDACIGGWFNANGGEYDAFLYFVVQSQEDDNEHEIENILNKFIEWKN